MNKQYCINLTIFNILLLASFSSVGFSKRVAEEELETEDRKAVAYVQQLHDTTAYIEEMENGEFGVFEKHLDLVYRVFKHLITPTLELITALQARETYSPQYGMFYSYMAAFLNEISTKAVFNIALKVENSIKYTTAVDFQQLEHLFEVYELEILERRDVCKLVISGLSKKVMFFRNMEDFKKTLFIKCRVISSGNA